MTRSIEPRAFFATAVAAVLALGLAAATEGAPAQSQSGTGAAATSAASAPAQRSFASAKDAADAFVAALGSNDAGQLDAMFGPRDREVRAHRQGRRPRRPQALAEAAQEGARCCARMRPIGSRS